TRCRPGRTPGTGCAGRGHLPERRAPPPDRAARGRPRRRRSRGPSLPTSAIARGRLLPLLHKDVSPRRTWYASVRRPPLLDGRQEQADRDIGRGDGHALFEQGEPRGERRAGSVNRPDAFINHLTGRLWIWPVPGARTV